MLSPLVVRWESEIISGAYQNSGWWAEGVIEPGTNLRITGGEKMGGGKKTRAEELKVTVEALPAPTGGRGIFGIEEEAEAVARQTKLHRMAERIAAYDRGYEGGRRRCPRCGQWQKYKGDAARALVFDCGTLTVQRAYYVCLGCRETSYPLDERLGLGADQEQGRLREKLALVA